MKITREKSIIRRLVFPIYLPSIIMSFGSGMILLILPLYAIEVTKSYSLASLTFAMMGPGTLLIDVPAGMLISRVGLKPAMTLGIVLMTGSALLAGVSDTAFLLGGAGFILGSGRGLVMLTRMTFISEKTTSEIGRAMSAVGGAMRVGVFLGPIFGGFIAELFSYQTALFIAGGIIACALGFVGFLDIQAKPALETSRKNPLHSVFSILAAYKSVFLTAGLAAMALQLMRSARTILIPLWGDSIGLDSAQIGLITGIPMGLEMTMFYPVGIIMDRFGRKWTSVPCMAIFAFGMSLVPLCHTFTALLLVVLIAGVGNGLGSGIFLTLGADFSPAEGRSDFLGVWRLFGDSGHTSGPFLISGITEAFTLAFAAFFTAAIGLTGAIIMLFLVKESRKAS